MTAFPKKAKFNFGRMARIELADALTVGLSTLPPVSACIPFKHNWIPFKKTEKHSTVTKIGLFFGGRGIIFSLETHSIFFFILHMGYEIQKITNARRRAGGGWAKRTMSMRS